MSLLHCAVRVQETQLDESLRIIFPHVSSSACQLGVSPKPDFRGDSLCNGWIPSGNFPPRPWHTQPRLQSLKAERDAMEATLRQLREEMATLRRHKHEAAGATGRELPWAAYGVKLHGQVQGLRLDGKDSRCCT